MKYSGIKYLVTCSKSNQNGLQGHDYDLLKSALFNKVRYSESKRYTCTKNPNSCSNKTYTQSTPILTYTWQPPNKMFFLFLKQKGYFSNSFPLFLTFSSCSLTLLHIIYQLVLINKYCTFNFSCWYQLYSTYCQFIIS